MAWPMRLATIVALLVSTLPAAAEAVPQCRYLPGMAELAESCSGEASPGEICKWIPIFEKLKTEDPSSAEPLISRSFGLGADVSWKLLPPLYYLMLFVTDSECAHRWTLRISEAGLPSLSEPAARYFLARVLPGCPKEMRHDMLDANPGRSPQLEDAGRLLEELLKAASLWGRAEQLASLFWGAAGGQPSGIDRLSADGGGNEAAARLERIRKLLLGDELEEARRLMAAPATGLGSEEAHFQARLSHFLYLMGFLEDALAATRRADLLLRSAESELPEDRYLRIILAWKEIDLLYELGLDDEAARRYREFSIPQEPLARSLIGMLGGFPASRTERRTTGLDAVFEKVNRSLSEILGSDSAAPLIKALTIVFATGFPAAPQPGSGQDVSWAWAETVIRERLQRNDFSGAISYAEAVFERIPVAQNLRIFMPILIQAIDSGRWKEAGSLATKLVGILERRVEQFRTRESASSFTHEFAYFYFMIATDLASMMGNSDEAFQLAERGRAFTLQQRLGNPRDGKEPQRRSAAEQAAENAVARRELRSSIDPVALQASYRDFESARLTRMLAARDETAGAVVRPIETEFLQRQILETGETLLAYHEGFEGRFWLSRMTRSEIGLHALASHRLAGAPCLAQLARWQDAPASLSRLAASRGANLLSDCPGLPAGEDAATSLYELLIAPVAGELETEGRIVIVPHGELHGVPFAALRDPATGRRLIEDHEIALAPSAAVLAQLRTRGGRAESLDKGNSVGGPAILGDPNPGWKGNRWYR